MQSTGRRPRAFRTTTDGVRIRDGASAVLVALGEFDVSGAHLGLGSAEPTPRVSGKRNERQGERDGE
ncbi:hypothetical protein GCM10022243_64400 [Saccharothrix violaceirubra]